MKWTADATGKKFFCGCKHTAKGPFCDGTHSKI
jgi:CDGSH iron-sulfur domain-containing protein 3